MNEIPNPNYKQIPEYCIDDAIKVAYKIKEKLATERNRDEIMTLDCIALILVAMSNYDLVDKESK